MHHLVTLIRESRSLPRTRSRLYRPVLRFLFHRVCFVFATILPAFCHLLRAAICKWKFVEWNCSVRVVRLFAASFVRFHFFEIPVYCAAVFRRFQLISNVKLRAAESSKSNAFASRVRSSPSFQIRASFRERCVAIGGIRSSYRACGVPLSRNLPPRLPTPSVKCANRWPDKWIPRCWS